MKPGNRWFFILLFFLMILFLINLDKLMKDSGYTSKFYYSEVDSQKITNQPFDVVSESLYFKINIKGKKKRRLHFENSAKIKIRLLSENIDTIKFNLTSNWKVKSSDPDLEFIHENDIIAIPVSSLPQGKKEYTLNFDFSGRPVKYHSWCSGLTYEFLLDSLYMETDKFMLSTISVPFGAHTWFLCKDTPDDKIDSLKITINVPKPMVALANGTLTAQKSIDERTEYTYELHSPVAPHLTGIFVAPYKKWEFNYTSDEGYSMPIRLFNYSEVEIEELQKIQERLLYIIDFFEEMLIPYPYANDGLKLIQHLMDGGMEIQTSIGVSEISLRYELLYVHEIAHQWVGDKITPRFSDIWLSEGLATYLTAIYIEKTIGEKEFYDFMIEKKITDEHSLIVKNIFSPDSLYSKYTYNKAAWILHMMRKTMGDKNFNKFLKFWVKHDPLKLYSTNDFFNMAYKIFPYNWTEFKEYWVVAGKVPQLVFVMENGNKYFKLKPSGNITGKINIILNDGKKNIQKSIDPESNIMINKIMGKRYPEDILKDFLCTLKYE